MNKKLKLWELNRVSEEEFKEQKKFPIQIILDDIRSLHNIGSFFRTADAFNVECIYLCGITARPPHREIYKTALGATESIRWVGVDSIDDLVDDLQKKGVKVCAIEQAAETTSLEKVAQLPEENYALVFGNEVDGVRQSIIDKSDYVIEVPQFGTKHSLNVSVCAGVVMWEFAKRYL